MTISLSGSTLNILNVQYSVLVESLIFSLQFQRDFKLSCLAIDIDRVAHTFCSFCNAGTKGRLF